MTNKYASLRCKCKNDHNGRANIGCIIYNRHYVYAYGMNRYNIVLEFSTIHAEIEAVNKLRV